MPDSTFIYEPAKPKTSNILIDILQTIVIALAITVVIYLFLAIPNQVDGQSMDDNFHNGELLLTNKVIQIIGDTPLGESLDYDYKRGNVIVFQQSGKKDFIKRIIAIGGDTIMIENNWIIINNMLIDEFYIPKTPEFKTTLPSSDIAFLKESEPRTVPEGKYFVMGDNRQHSQDSRYSTVGWVDRNEIKGRVFLRFWPLDRFGLISSGESEEIPYTSSQN